MRKNNTETTVIRVDTGTYLGDADIINMILETIGDGYTNKITFDEQTIEILSDDMVDEEG